MPVFCIHGNHDDPIREGDSEVSRINLCCDKGAALVCTTNSSDVNMNGYGYVYMTTPSARETPRWATHTTDRRALDAPPSHLIVLRRK
jgi:DNA repair exonuclease SbcCD nuclease subunit